MDDLVLLLNYYMLYPIIQVKLRVDNIMYVMFECMFFAWFIEKN